MICRQKTGTRLIESDACFLLCLYLCPVLKGDPDILFAVHRDEIYQARPQPFIKLRDRLLHLHRMEELLQQLFAVSFVGDRLGDLIKLCLDRFISADQTIVTLGIQLLTHDLLFKLVLKPLSKIRMGNIYYRFCPFLYCFPLKFCNPILSYKIINILP